MPLCLVHLQHLLLLGHLLQRQAHSNNEGDDDNLLENSHAEPNSGIPAEDAETGIGPEIGNQGIQQAHDNQRGAHGKAEQDPLLSVRNQSALQEQVRKDEDRAGEYQDKDDDGHLDERVGRAGDGRVGSIGTSLDGDADTNKTGDGEGNESAAANLARLWEETVSIPFIPLLVEPFSGSMYGA
jgi:hypothetical protein